MQVKTWQIRRGLVELAGKDVADREIAGKAVADNEVAGRELAGKDVAGRQLQEREREREREIVRRQRYEVKTEIFLNKHSKYLFSKETPSTGTG